VRYKLILEYDGSGFCGFERQAQGERTVQGELERALLALPGGGPPVVAAGRTDSGVHAWALPVHCDFSTPFPEAKLAGALNAHLPPDLRVVSAQIAPPGFNARQSCHWRQYRYRILNRPVPPALERQRVAWVVQELNREAMGQALPVLLGRHDFAPFATQEIRPTRRTIYRAEMTESGPDITLEFAGDGFLRSQVRRMAGSLIAVGLGKIPDLAAVLAGQIPAGATAPAAGLYFVAAGYQPWPES
jgi:tRNA pseudouridine38-40 synthase